MSGDSIPFFLLQLNLGLDADARAIRSAYARAVKKIDQEAEAGAFQDLREAYEMALFWTKAKQAASSADQAAPQLPAPVDPHDPKILAAHAFDRLALAIEKLSRGAALDDIGLWSAELATRLDDAELINISARALFEARVVDHLVNHWAPGNVTLFAAAVEVFDWDQDRRRLRTLGYNGHSIDHAIDEWRHFKRQLPAEHLSQIKVINRLRAPGEPRLIQVRRDLPVVFRMLERVPNWLAISADSAVIERWRAMAPEVPTTPVDDAPYRGRSGDNLALIYLIGVLVVLLKSCN